MERAERTPVAPAAPFLAGLAASYERFLDLLGSGHRAVYPETTETAFTDEMERELIRRELHPF